MELPVVTLLTDFGTRDHYVGVLKGVILRGCPGAPVVDISHDVAPFQIAQGAYLLDQAWRWFPSGSIHVAVVDPGVGSARRALVAENASHRFVLPDNGLLSLLSMDQPVVREIRNADLLLHPVSSTFHGRDVFAPVAAHLASGLPIEHVGPVIDDWVRLPRVVDAVLHIDRFGNVITSYRAAEFDLGHRSRWSLRVGDATITHFADTYAGAPGGEPFVIGGSSGYLEISVREGSAAELMRCRVGDPVKLLPADKS